MNHEPYMNEHRSQIARTHLMYRRRRRLRRRGSMSVRSTAYILHRRTAVGVRTLWRRSHRQEPTVQRHTRLAVRLGPFMTTGGRGRHSSRSSFAPGSSDAFLPSGVNPGRVGGRANAETVFRGATHAASHGEGALRQAAHALSCGALLLCLRHMDRAPLADRAHPSDVSSSSSSSSPWIHVGEIYSVHTPPPYRRWRPHALA